MSLQGLISAVVVNDDMITISATADITVPEGYAIGFDISDFGSVFLDTVKHIFDMFVGDF